MWTGESSILREPRSLLWGRFEDNAASPDRYSPIENGRKATRNKACVTTHRDGLEDLLPFGNFPSGTCPLFHLRVFYGHMRLVWEAAMASSGRHYAGNVVRRSC